MTTDPPAVPSFPPALIAWAVRRALLAILALPPVVAHAAGSGGFWGKGDELVAFALP